MSSKLKLRLEKILIYEYIDIESCLHESLEKESFLNHFCETNNFHYEKCVIVDPSIEQYLIVVNLYSYE
jgi:hypothetical protein